MISIIGRGRQACLSCRCRLHLLFSSPCSSDLLSSSLFFFFLRSFSNNVGIKRGCDAAQSFTSRFGKRLASQCGNSACIFCALHSKPNKRMCAKSCIPLVTLSASFAAWAYSPSSGSEEQKKDSKTHFHLSCSWPAVRHGIRASG